MLWKTFLKYNQEELFTLWYNWVPKKDVSDKKEEKEEVTSKTYYVTNPLYNFWFDSDHEEYVTNGEEEFLEFVDDGSRITSFEYFVCCAYENSIP